MPVRYSGHTPPGQKIMLNASSGLKQPNSPICRILSAWTSEVIGKNSSSDTLNFRLKERDLKALDYTFISTLWSQAGLFVLLGSSFLISKQNANFHSPSSVDPLDWIAACALVSRSRRCGLLGNIPSKVPASNNDIDWSTGISAWLYSCSLCPCMTDW